jgi:hypothetical protein
MYHNTNHIGHRIVASLSSQQIFFASNYFYDVGMGFPKLNMLAFYWAYFNLEAQPAMRKMLWAMTAFVVACYLTILFDDTYFCGRNVSVQWSQEEGACSVFYAPEPFILNFTLNLACYLVVYSIPLILLTRNVLRLSTGVALTSALGALTIISSIVRFVTLQVGTGQKTSFVSSLEKPKNHAAKMHADTNPQIPLAWSR